MRRNRGPPAHANCTVQLNEDFEDAESSEDRAELRERVEGGCILMDKSLRLNSPSRTR